MIKSGLKQTQTSRETDIRSYDGDLRNKTFFEKKIVQKSLQNNTQKWISKTSKFSHFLKTLNMFEGRMSNFQKNPGKSNMLPECPKHTLINVYVSWESVQ